MNPASVLAFELHGNNQTVGNGVNVLITGVTDLTLDGILNVTATASGSFASAEAGDTWRLINYSGPLADNGLALGSLPPLNSGLAYEIDTSIAGQVNLMISTAAVPEPSSFVAMGLVAALSTFAVAIHQLRATRASRSAKY
jgi:hypothetical protein